MLLEIRKNPYQDVSGNAWRVDVVLDDGDRFGCTLRDWMDVTELVGTLPMRIHAYESNEIPNPLIGRPHGR